MLFNTIEFALFLPIVLILYFSIPHRWRWCILLAASYYFYMCWKVEYIFLILASTLIDYFMAIQIEKNPHKKWKFLLLLVSLVTNFGLLFYFKYYNFVSTSLNELFAFIKLDKEIPMMKLLLPVGISFYTFQTLSYTIDVFFGKQKAEKHLGYFALYVTYFPQLVAGPIERFSTLTPQLKEKHTFTYENLKKGFQMILYGLFIKMVIADNLSGFVDQIYASPTDFGSRDLVTGIFLYSFQIYSDFFGYSTIAIGSSILFGIHLMDNFKTPYLAKNISEFWQRWHISLSTWFRDYVYFPMGGNRVAKGRWFLNIMVVFVASGIWHGANWTFLIWGFLYGLIYILERVFNDLFHITKKWKPYSIGHLFLALKTFVLVTLIWIFFRSQSFHEAIVMFQSIFSNNSTPKSSLIIPAFVWIFLGLFILSDFLFYNKRFDIQVNKMPFWGRWVVYAVLIFSIIVFSGVDNFPFIYFQF